MNAVFLRIFYFLTLFFVFNPCAIFSQERGNTMIISSQSFKEGEMIGSQYTCDGANISPELTWSGAPDGTKSFAVSVIDPDAPMGDFIHWLIYNIPANVNSITEGGQIPSGSIEVINDFGKKSYGGPCPPSGTHRYYFTVYALDSDSIVIGNKLDFLKVMETRAISKSHIMGKYTRKK